MRLTTALFLTAIVTPALAQSPPRKAGLWEEAVTRHIVDGRDRTAEMAQFAVTKYCVDADSEQRTAAMGARLNPARCERLGSQQIGATTVSESACKFGGASTRIQRVTMKNSDVAYTVLTSFRREGGTPSETQTTIEATWTGECAPDQKPGDIISSNGTRNNIGDLPRPAAP